MKRYFALALAIGVMLLGCSKLDPIAPPHAGGGAANFGVYVALGTSLGAGYTNGGVVERHQRRSYAYLFAEAAATPSFTA